MKIKILRSCGGSGFNYQFNEIVTEGDELILGDLMVSGYAEPLDKKARQLLEGHIEKRALVAQKNEAPD